MLEERISEHTAFTLNFQGLQLELSATIHEVVITM